MHSSVILASRSLITSSVKRLNVQEMYTRLRNMKDSILNVLAILFCFKYKSAIQVNHIVLVLKQLCFVPTINKDYYK